MNLLNILLQQNGYGDGLLAPLLWILIAFLIILFIRYLFGPIEALHSNWNYLIEDFKFSTKEFYNLLQEEFEKSGIKEAELSDVNIYMGGSFSSSKRHYLEIKYKNYSYLCCFAPFGNGSFVSWWLFYHRNKFVNALCNMPWIGRTIERAFFPITFYKIDTASMFMRYVHASVLRVVDDITKTKGLRMTENQRTPDTHNHFGDKRRK